MFELPEHHACVLNVLNVDRVSTEGQRLRRRAWADPAVGAYDMERAWAYLQHNVPAVVMAFAQDR